MYKRQAFALTGCWYCDLARGIVPDFFTLFPLAALGSFAAVEGEWRVLISAAVPFVPFALAAVFSRGRGMGWGDAKLVALGGAVLGFAWRSEDWVPVTLPRTPVASNRRSINDSHP